MKPLGRDATPFRPNKKKIYISAINDNDSFLYNLYKESDLCSVCKITKSPINLP